MPETSGVSMHPETGLLQVETSELKSSRVNLMIQASSGELTIQRKVAIYLTEEHYDADNDGVSDADDEFPYDPRHQSDLDQDGVGDFSDDDIDNDELPNGFDRKPYEFNASLPLQWATFEDTFFEPTLPTNPHYDSDEVYVADINGISIPVFYSKSSQSVLGIDLTSETVQYKTLYQPLGACEDDVFAPYIGSSTFLISRDCLESRAVNLVSGKITSRFQNKFYRVDDVLHLDNIETPNVIQFDGPNGWRYLPTNESTFEPIIKGAPEIQADRLGAFTRADIDVNGLDDFVQLHNSKAYALMNRTQQGDVRLDFELLSFPVVEAGRDQPEPVSRSAWEVPISRSRSASQVEFTSLFISENEQMAWLYSKSVCQKEHHLSEDHAYYMAAEAHTEKCGHPTLRADINGDGHLDIVVRSGLNVSWVWFDNGLGAFYPVAKLHGEVFGAADFDQDGTTDFISLQRPSGYGPTKYVVTLMKSGAIQAQPGSTTEIELPAYTGGTGSANWHIAGLDSAYFRLDPWRNSVVFDAPTDKFDNNKDGYYQAWLYLTRGDETISRILSVKVQE